MVFDQTTINNSQTEIYYYIVKKKCLLLHQRPYRRIKQNQ